MLPSSLTSSTKIGVWLMAMKFLALMTSILIMSGCYLYYLSMANSRRGFMSGPANALIKFTGFGMTTFGLLSIAALFYTLSYGSYIFLNEMGIKNILLGMRWNPPTSYQPGIEENLGFLPLDLSTLLVAFTSGIISIFFGRALGIQTAMLEGKKKFFMLLFLYIFLMIPSVTWAFMGGVYLQPFMGQLLELPNDKTILSTAITVAGLNTPVVAILTNAAIGTVPSANMENARINRASLLTKWKWYIKPEIKWQLWVISVVVILRGAAETTVTSRLMGGVQDLTKYPIWEWLLKGGNTLAKVSSEYIKPEAAEHPMITPGGADFALAKIFINMGIVVVVMLLFFVFDNKWKSSREYVPEIKYPHLLKSSSFNLWLKSSCLVGISTVVFVFLALFHTGGHMVKVTKVYYEGECPVRGKISKPQFQEYISQQLEIQLDRKVKKDISKIYSLDVINMKKGVACNPGEYVAGWFLPSTQTDGYAKSKDPLLGRLFNTRSFGPKDPQPAWIDQLIEKELVKITWHKTLFTSTGHKSDPFKNGYLASFLSSLQNSLVAIFAVIAAFIAAIVIRFYFWKSLQMPVSMVIALSLSIPALGYGYMAKINFVNVLGLPNAANITLYLATWMVVFMVAVVNFTSTLQEVPESALDTGRSHSFRKIESIVKYVISKKLQGFCLIGALAMTAGLQETSQWFAVGGLNLSLDDPSLALLGEARPLNAVAYGLRTLANPAYEALEACHHMALIGSILPFSILAAVFERK